MKPQRDSPETSGAHNRTIRRATEWLARESTLLIYGAYLALVGALFVAYFGRVPPDRAEFYRQMRASWRFWLGW